MNMKPTILILALTAVAPAWAGNSPIAELAQRSGLSERKVQMLLGNRTSYAEYRYTYQRSYEKLVAAIGQDNFDKLVQGEAMVARERQGDFLAVQGSAHPVDLPL